MRCLLVDKIISWEQDRSITGIKNVTMSENFLQDHFPGFPVMPGVLQTEAVVQLGAWLVFASTGGRHKARLANIQSIKFKEFIVPGDQMRIEIDVTRQEPGQTQCNARVCVGDTLKTELRRLLLTHVPVEDLEDPQAAQNHFAFITGNAPRGGYSAAPRQGTGTTRQG